MVEHKFEWQSDGNWKVTCPKTKGNFYISLWRKGKVKDQKCPCCNGLIRRKK